MLGHTYFFASTDIGNNRTNNEDSFICVADKGLWILADGMGGHEAGEIASDIAVNFTAKGIIQGKTSTQAICDSHNEILAAGEKGVGVPGMGSTIVTLQITHNTYNIAWVGDSRAYIWSPETKSLSRITTDHSYVQMLYEAGSITEEEIDNHPDKHIITQCLGSLENSIVKVDTVEGVWQNNELILLCSDGLSDTLSDQEIASILNENSEPKQAVNILINAALHAGANDNITAVVVKYPTFFDKLKHKLGFDSISAKGMPSNKKSDNKK